MAELIMGEDGRFSIITSSGVRSGKIGSCTSPCRACGATIDECAADGPCCEACTDLHDDPHRNPTEPEV